MSTGLVVRKVEINSQAVASIVGGMGQRSVANAANKTVERTRANIRKQGRVYTGAMLRDTHAEFARDSTPLKAKAIVTLGGGHYAAFQEFGTRAHGPRYAPRMVFRIRGKGPLIFAKWVRGVTPGKFLQDAYAQLSNADFIAGR